MDLFKQEQKEIKEESKINIDLDNLAKDYAIKVKNDLKELKNKKTDIHFEDMEIEELTNEDLIIFDKFQKNNLTEKEFNDYRKNLGPYFRLQRQLKGEEFNSLKDSRSNFSAMIANKIMAKKVEEMLKSGQLKKAA